MLLRKLQELGTKSVNGPNCDIGSLPRSKESFFTVIPVKIDLNDSKSVIGERIDSFSDVFTERELP